jgi:segregation and condensation protein A
MIVKHDHFALANFEGPLDFLLCLIQREEIEIYDIPIQELIQQFIDQLSHCEKGFERGAEFIGSAAYLVWLKSKALLPSTEQSSDPKEQIEDPHFEIIHHLIDYCHFKQAAKELTFRQEKQQACYFRGVEATEWKKPIGIDHVSLEELSSLFREMMERAAKMIQPQIQEENWRVCDKIKEIRRLLQENPSFPFANLFTSEQSRLEIIVIFLAVLELMKMGELAVGREKRSAVLCMIVKEGKS